MCPDGSIGGALAHLGGHSNTYSFRHGEWPRGVVPLSHVMCRNVADLFMACGGVSWGVYVGVLGLGGRCLVIILIMKSRRSRGVVLLS